MNKKIIIDVIRWVLVPVIFFIIFATVFRAFYDGFFGLRFSECVCTTDWPSSRCDCVPSLFQWILMFGVSVIASALVAPKYKIITGMVMIIFSILWMIGLSSMAY